MKQLLAFALVVILCGVVNAQNELIPLFNTHMHYPVGVEPYDLCIADFNGDGTNDVGVACYGWDTISIAISNNDGTVQPLDNYYISSPYAVIANKLDNNSSIDLVIMTSSEVFTMMNNGDGTFGAASQVTIPGSPRAVYLADVDNDTDNDLLMVNWEWLFDSVGVFLNDGNGAFGAATNYYVGGAPYELCTGHYDSDAFLDMAVITGAGELVVFFNNGDGTFGGYSPYTVSPGPQRVVSGDVDDDSDADLISLSTSGGATVTAWLNDGSGNFAAGPTSAIEADPDDMAVSDLNGDNLADIVVSGDFLEILYNTGGGAFSQGALQFVAYEANYLALGDLDGDGWTDIAATGFPWDYSYDPGFVVVMMNDGAGNFPAAPKLDVIDQNQGMCVADLDGDTDLDLAVNTYWLGMGTADSLVIYANDGSGNYVELSRTVIGNKGWSVTPADLDGDTDIDLIVGYSDLSRVSVLLNNGSGTFSGLTDYTVQSKPRYVFAADFDGDTDIDLAVSNNTSASVSILLNNGNATFATATHISIPANPYSITGADFYDNDGDIDLVVPSPNSTDLFILRGAGNGTFSPVELVALGDYPDWAAIDDLDNDGDLDIVTSNSYYYTVSVLENDNHTAFLAPDHYDVAPGPNMVVTGDFDKDNFSDIAVLSSDAYSLTLMVNEGNLTFTPDPRYGVGDDPEVVVVGDLDGDNNLDMAVANYNEGTVSLLLNQYDILVDVNDPFVDALPTRHVLSQNYPNPFNAGTRIEFSLPSRSHVTLAIHNILGRHVKTIIDGTKPAGSHVVFWNGSDASGYMVASGIYFYRLTAGDTIDSRKMVLLK